MAPKLHRRCLSCRRLAHRDEFFRVVRLPAETDVAKSVQIDQGMGRSAYICKNPECLQQAQKKNRLGRSLHINIPTEIFMQLASQLHNS